MGNWDALVWGLGDLNEPLGLQSECLPHSWKESWQEVDTEQSPTYRTLADALDRSELTQAGIVFSGRTRDKTLRNEHLWGRKRQRLLLFRRLSVKL